MAAICHIEGWSDVIINNYPQSSLGFCFKKITQDFFQICRFTTSPQKISTSDHEEEPHRAVRGHKMHPPQPPAGGLSGTWRKLPSGRVGFLLRPVGEKWWCKIGKKKQKNPHVPKSKIDPTNENGAIKLCPWTLGMDEQWYLGFNPGVTWVFGRFWYLTEQADVKELNQCRKPMVEWGKAQNPL